MCQYFCKQLTCPGLAGQQCGKKFNQKVAVIFCKSPDTTARMSGRMCTSGAHSVLFDQMPTNLPSRSHRYNVSEIGLCPDCDNEEEEMEDAQLAPRRPVSGGSGTPPILQPQIQTLRRPAKSRGSKTGGTPNNKKPQLPQPSGKAVAGPSSLVGKPVVPSAVTKPAVPPASAKPAVTGQEKGPSPTTSSAAQPGAVDDLSSDLDQLDEAYYRLTRVPTASFLNRERQGEFVLVESDVGEDDDDDIVLV